MIFENYLKFHNRLRTQQALEDIYIYRYIENNIIPRNGRFTIDGTMN